MKPLVNWLDHRTGVRDFVHEALFERVPGGARWRYVWGSTLVFTFSMQVITGFALWMYYSPSAQTAWESVYFIQHETQFGWLVRGMHHFTAQAMVVLLALHLMQVVIDGAYRAPREFNFWIGLVLMQIVLGLSLTGYLLPWDQKGYWATRVATNLLGVVPVVGPSLQQLVVGGADYGHHTLTRFFALHAGILPTLLVGFLVVHVALFRRHGLRYKEPPKYPDAMFWPDQILKDAVACLAVLVVVLVLCMRPFSWFSEDAVAFGPHAGAELGAPADPANQYSAARPEWYFLFLFQFLKLFEGWGEQGELLGAVVMPGLVMGGLFLMPLIGRWKLGHRFNIAMIVILLCGVAYLTIAAVGEDYQARWTDPAQFAEFEPVFDELGTDETKIAAHFKDDPVAIADYHRELVEFEHYRKSLDYLKSVEDAQVESERVIELASGPEKIPTTGAITLLRNDAKTQGPKLFAAHCASCHTFLSPEEAKNQTASLAKATAPNLYGFADRNWIRGFLNPSEIDSHRYFGGTSHKEGEMVGFVKDTMSGWEPADVDKVVLALSAEAQLPSQAAADQKDAEAIAAGRKLIAGEENCAMCHKFHDVDLGGTAPALTGYGSREWLIGMISDPAHASYYGESNDRMPAFAAAADDAPTNLLSQQAIGTLADWLRGVWYRPEQAAHGEQHAEAAPAKMQSESEPAEAPPAEATPPEPADPEAASETPASEPAPSESKAAEPEPAQPEPAEPPAADPEAPPAEPEPAPASEPEAPAETPPTEEPPASPQSL